MRSYLLLRVFIGPNAFYGSLWILISPNASLRILMRRYASLRALFVPISPDVFLWILVGPYGS